MSEKPFRYAGDAEGRQKCLEYVLEKYDEVKTIISVVLEIKGLRAVEYFIFQSRAMGTCKTSGTSDMDMYVQLSEEHSDLVEELGIFIIEGKHPTSTYGTWHPESMDSLDPYSLHYMWPHKIIHDSEVAEKLYNVVPVISKELQEQMEEIRMHLNWGVHPYPPKKQEYGDEKYFVTFSELGKRYTG